MEFEIWGTDNDGNPVEIKTLAALKDYGKTLKPEYFSDPEENKQFLLWFFGKVEKLRDKLDAVEMLFARTDIDAEEFLKDMRVIDAFDNLVLDEDTYLPEEPTVYVKAAKALVTSLPEAVRETAAARIALNAMALAILPNALPNGLRNAMLAPWRQQEEGFRVICVDTKQSVHFEWKALDPRKPLVMTVIKNTTPLPVELELKSDVGSSSVWIPGGGSVTALYVGQYMTCITGGLCVSGDHAACRQGEKIVKYCISSGKCTDMAERSPEELRGIALHTNGKLHCLEGDTAKVWDGNEQKVITGCLGVYALDSVWVVHKKDGSTDSNLKRMRQKDVIAVVQSEEDLILVTRSGAVHSVYKKTYDLREAMTQMVRRYDLLLENEVERLVYRGNEIIRTREGKVICRPLT